MAADTESNPSRERRDQRLAARITRSDKELLDQAVVLEGTDITEFVARSVRAEAERVVREHETMALTARDSYAFVSALLEDAEPNEKLQAAARDYRARTGRP